MENSSSNRTNSIIIIVSVLLHLLLIFFLLTYKDLYKFVHQTQLTRSPVAPPTVAKIIMAPATPVTPKQTLVDNGQILASSTNDIKETNHAKETNSTQSVRPELIEGSIQNSSPAIHLPPELTSVPPSFDKLRTNGIKQVNPAGESNKKSLPQPVTLKDVTKSFFKSVQQEQTTKTNTGNPGEPSDYDVRGVAAACIRDAKQLALSNYKTKIYVMLGQAFAGVTNLLFSESDVNITGFIAVTINKNGSIDSIAFEHNSSSKNFTSLEQYFKDVVRTAGLCPPIPRQFEVEKITLKFSTSLHYSAGTHKFSIERMQ